MDKLSRKELSELKRSKRRSDKIKKTKLRELLRITLAKDPRSLVEQAKACEMDYKSLSKVRTDSCGPPPGFEKMIKALEILDPITAAQWHKENPE